MGEKVAILDAGAQYGKVIDRRVRELHVESDILPMDTPAEKLREYKGIIISGGPQSVFGKKAPKYDPAIFSLGIAMLGICYGKQLMNHVLGGTVETKGVREDSDYEVSLDTTSLLFTGLNSLERVLLTHGDSVGQLAPGFKEIARSESNLIAAIEHREKKMYGVQFHPETDRTVHGKMMLRNFLYDIAGCTGTYTMEDREQKAITYLRNTVGDKKVVVLVSGGVDSTVTAALLVKALGPQNVYAIHVDNGFMRKGESVKVYEALRAMGLQLQVIHAQEEFYCASTMRKGAMTSILRDTIAPEEKRSIIGDTFMRIAEREMRKLGLTFDNAYLAQGTLRPDLIESASAIASGEADAIKTHHNDTELVRKWRDAKRLIEPLQDYHKDEVRELGLQLGLPGSIVKRQPFPGPGLSIRVICADKPFIGSAYHQTNDNLWNLTHYSQAPLAFRTALRQMFQDPETGSAKASERIEERLSNIAGVSGTLLPIKTVGVQGDGRSYSYLAGLSGTKGWDDLFFLAKLIPQINHNVNRIVYVFGDKVEGPITDVTCTLLRNDAVDQLRVADDIVNTTLLQYDLLEKLAQVPVISFPVHFGVPGNRSIGIRTFMTNDFMTGVPAIPNVHIPEEALDIMVQRILAEVPCISRVAYDLTSKPPGTTEWE